MPKNKSTKRGFEIGGLNQQKVEPDMDTSGKNLPVEASFRSKLLDVKGYSTFD